MTRWVLVGVDSVIGCGCCWGDAKGVKAACTCSCHGKLKGGDELLEEILTARDALLADDEPISFRAAALLEALEKLGDA